MYCTLEQARRHGAQGEDADVTAAIAEAETRVDAFTGDHFEPVTDTARLRVKHDYAPSRRRIQSITTVERDNGETLLALPATAWEAEPHGVRVRLGGYDVLIAGAEPWNGGWAGLVGNLDGRYITVTGTFGWEQAPSPVAEATARLAADLSRPTFTPSANEEGDPIGVPPAEPQDTDPVPAGRLERTTGNADADRLLAGYVSAPWKMG